ncbi:hypothetical protein BKA65DRAFT_376721, partial [Rhexocercosporidium sp. MPI-PUGE-AT-0058]
MQFSTLIALALPAVALAAPAPITSRAAGWTIRNFSRNCTNPNICTYNFTIDTGSGTQQCTTVDIASPATTHPWYGVSCQQQNKDWYASWGWDYNGDFTVMTVVNVPSQMEAFFGYNHPNAGLPIAHYADV